MSLSSGLFSPDLQSKHPRIVIVQAKYGASIGAPTPQDPPDAPPTPAADRRPRS
jgi:hypothetical protein